MDYFSFDPKSCEFYSESISRSQKPFKVAIIGAGISGLALAVGLAYRGVPYHIYESESSFSACGASIAISSDAARTMSRIHPKLIDSYNGHAIFNYSYDCRHMSFEYRVGMKMAPDEYGRERNWEGNIVSRPQCGEEGNMATMNRARFLGDLVELLPKPITASFGKKLKNVQDLGSAGARLHFEDGTIGEADAVIGCDGITSQVRRCVFGPEYAADFTGNYAYIGNVPMCKAISAVGQRLARNSQGYLGYGGHVLTMPADQGSTMSVLAFQTKKDGIWGDHNPLLKQANKIDMLADFADWSKDVKMILKNMDSEVYVWAQFDHLKAVKQFWKGRACLIGDAAHASIPHQGAGTAVALEDAYSLADLIAKMENAEGFETAFGAYNLARYKHGIRLVATSLAATQICQFRGPSIEDDLRKINEVFKHGWERICTELFFRWKGIARHECHDKDPNLPSPVRSEDLEIIYKWGSDSRYRTDLNEVNRRLMKYLSTQHNFV